MKPSKERPEERFVVQSEELLADLGDIDAIVAEAAGGGHSSDIEHLEAMRLMNESMVLPAKGHIELTISDDEMSAAMDFFPPSGDAPPLDLDDVREKIRTNRISADIDWKAIEEAVLTCNTDRLPVTDVQIAKGRLPVDAELAHLVVERDLAEPQHREAVTEYERIDYRNTSPFVLVKRGQVVARLVPATQGELGSTIFGKAIPYKTVKGDGHVPGKNVVQDGETLLSGCDGRLSLENDSISVSPALEIPHDVDFRTGHVDFPGDVLIHGDIKTGFKVQSGGSLVCLQTIEGADVSCEKDLVVKRGIIGKLRGSVHVKGSVSAKFVENTFLEAHGPIRIEVGILQFDGSDTCTHRHGIAGDHRRRKDNSRCRHKRRPDRRCPGSAHGDLLRHRLFG